MAEKVDDIIKVLKSNGFWNELKGNGTNKETQDWVVEEVSKLVILFEEIADLKNKEQQKLNEMDKLIQSDSRLSVLREEIRDTRIAYKSCEKRWDAEFNLLFDVIKAKLMDGFQKHNIDWW